MDADALSKATQYTAANSARKQTVMTQPTNHAIAAATPANRFDFDAIQRIVNDGGMGMRM